MIGLIIIVMVVLSVRFIFSGQTPTITNPYLYKDLIRIDSPIENQKISASGPVTVSGSARGNWYFEASFPVQVLDSDKTVLGSSPVQAQGDWMTTDFVPFTGEINFEKPKGKTGSIIFKKDNSSGLPENDDSVSIPINFK